jgi:hypothetical protein
MAAIPTLETVRSYANRLEFPPADYLEVSV